MLRNYWMNSMFTKKLIRAWKHARCKRCLIIMILAVLGFILVQGTTPIRTPTNHFRAYDSAASQKRLSAMLRTCEKPGAYSMGKAIPKIFHQTYKNELLPADYRKYIIKCRNLNPDWSYFLWRDKEIVAFIAQHFPQYQRKYLTFTMNVQRADFIRYMVLYKYGGIYLDMDVECLKPFFPILESHAAFLDQERKEHAQILYDREFTAMNSAMGSAPGHPFYLYMLESIDSADDRLEGAGLSTGPDRLTIAYAEWSKARLCHQNYPVTLLEPEVLSPLVDTSIHDFGALCAKQNDQSKWLKAGCQLMASKTWKVDSTNERTVGKHLFLHMGYNWGPKAKGYFNIAKELGPVHYYKSNST